MKDIFGYLGATLLTITLLPQLYLSFTSKKTRDISIIFLCLQLLTCTFFLIYGIYLEENPLIIANSIVLFQSGLLFYAKLRFKENIDNTIDNTIDNNNISTSWV